MVSLQTRVLEYMQRADYRPLDKVELSKSLGIHHDDRRLLRDALRELEDAGKITLLRQNRYALPEVENLLTGRLQVHRNGNAHLLASKPGDPEVFVAAADLGTALPDDTVQVKLKGSKKRPAPGEAREGVVVRVIERATLTVVGLVQQTPRKQFYIIPDDPRFQRHVFLCRGPEEVRAPLVGEKVVARLRPWENAQDDPEAELTEVLGRVGEPGVDMLSVVRKHGLSTEFPPEVLAEAERIPEKISPREIAAREDLREKMIITIDPDDARDFDDAIDVTPLRGKGGAIYGWRLGVHIADVSHYVQPGSPLDVEAQKRGNSTYLADRVLPMLPERLSNGICSLKPGVERLTFSAFLEFDREGNITSARFGKSVIRSAVRLSYRQALAILQGQDHVPPLSAALEKETRGVATVTKGAPVPVRPETAKAVREAWELAAVLRQKRFGAGSLDLDFPEVKVWLDDQGKATRLEKSENDESHQLIEEFMLAANEAVARELTHQLVPSVHRIHENPDPERLADFRDLALEHGLKVGDLTNRREVQKTLAAIRGLPEEYALKLAFLKSLKRAQYSEKGLGHYGLAKVHYTHFTSPIRRYADLVVHRSLARAVSLRTDGPKKPQRAKDGQAPVSSEMHGMAEHISKTERISADAEKESTLLKKIEYFQLQLASKTPDHFQAVVTEVRPFGLMIELPDVLMSSLLHVNSMKDDHYVFDAVRKTFTGRRTHRRYKLGDRFEVVVAAVDAARRQIDFAPVPESHQSAQPAAPKSRIRTPEPESRPRPADERRRSGARGEEKRHPDRRRSDSRDSGRKSRSPEGDRAHAARNPRTADSNDAYRRPAERSRRAGDRPPADVSRKSQPEHPSKYRPLGPLLTDNPPRAERPRRGEGARSQDGSTRADSPRRADNRRRGKSAPPAKSKPEKAAKPAWYEGAKKKSRQRKAGGRAGE